MDNFYGDKVREESDPEGTVYCNGCGQIYNQCECDTIFQKIGNAVSNFLDKLTGGK